MPKRKRNSSPEATRRTNAPKSKKVQGRSLGENKATAKKPAASPKILHKTLAKFNPKLRSAAEIKTALASSSSFSSTDCGNPLTKFKGQVQAQGNWCWAAVAASIADYYDNKDWIKQCIVASASIPTSGQDCCKTPSSTACNVTVLDIGIPLTRTQNRGGPAWLHTLPPIIDVMTNINNCKPIAVGINWLSGPAKGNGHAVAIIGYDVSDPAHFKLIIWDPSNDVSGGQKTVDYAAFSTQYNGQTISIEDCVSTQPQP